MIVMFGTLLYFKMNDLLLVKQLSGENDDETDIKEIFAFDNVRLCYSNRIFQNCTINAEFKEELMKGLKLLGMVEDKKALLSDSIALIDSSANPEDYLSIFDTIINAAGKMKKPKRADNTSFSNDPFFFKRIKSFFWQLIDAIKPNDYSTHPHELSKIVAYLLDDRVETIFDPFGGLMDFATTMKEKRFVAFIGDDLKRDVSMYRLALAGILDHCVLHRNPINEWIDDNSFQAIVTFPPFNGLIKMNDGDGQQEEKAELVALRRFETTTTDDGQLISFMPQTILWSEEKSDIELREQLTRQNLLDAVICLPKTNSLRPTAIVILKKKRAKNEPIKFVDASSSFITKQGKPSAIDVKAVIRLYNGKASLISKEEILAQQSSWNVYWLQNNDRSVFRDGYTVAPLSEVITPFESGQEFSEANGIIINDSTLSDDFFNYEIHPDHIAPMTLYGSSKIITEPVLLLASKKGSVKPSYCLASEKMPVYITPDVKAYKIINSTVYPGYLCMELSKRLKDQSKAFNPERPLSGLLMTRVGFPSLNAERSYAEQKNIFDNIQTEFQEGQIRELGLQQTINKMVTDQMAQIRQRKHSLMQVTSPLALDWKDLKEYLLKNHNKFNVDDTIGNLHPITIGELITSISEYISTIETRIMHFTDDDWDYGPIEDIDLREFVEDFINKHKSARYMYLFNPSEDEKKYLIRMPRKALLQVLENIVSNAVSHGFTSHDNESAYYIKFDIDDDHQDELVLEVSNNGEPLPDGVDTEFIITEGRSTKLDHKEDDKAECHHGLGGKEIFDILKKHDASIDVLPSPVTYRIIFKSKTK
jgi:type I restriction enzyme M protein